MFSQCYCGFSPGTRSPKTCTFNVTGTLWMRLLVLYPCVPATNRWRVQGATLPSPQDSLDLLQNLLRSHVQGKQWQMIEGGEAANANPECFVSFQPSFPDWAKATPKHDSSISSWSVLPRIFTPPRRNLIKSIIYPQRPPRGVTKMLLNDKGILSTFFFFKDWGQFAGTRRACRFR